MFGRKSEGKTPITTLPIILLCFALLLKKKIVLTWVSTLIITRATSRRHQGS